MMRYSALRNTVPPSIRLAITCLAMVCFITTAAGILALETGSATWRLLCVAILLSGGLAVGIAVLAHHLYERFTLTTLVALLALASIAALFDAAFFSSLFAPQLAVTTVPLQDVAHRVAERDRLTREMTRLVASHRPQLQEAEAEAARAEAAALRAAETEERIGTDGKPGRGPRWRRHVEEAAAHGATREEITRRIARLDETPVQPASDRWEHLDAFHGEIVGLSRIIPGDDLGGLAGSPVRPSGLTDRGTARDVGGLASVLDLATAGRFDDLRLIVPLAISAICEYTVVILVLGTRPWRPVREWGVGVLEGVEEVVDGMPALGPLARHVVSRGMLHDDPERAAQRRRRYKRRAAWADARLDAVELAETLADFDVPMSGTNCPGDGAPSSVEESPSLAAALSATTNSGNGKKGEPHVGL